VDLEFFVDPEDASRCKPVIARMNKLRLSVLELDTARARNLNGHSVAFVPITQDMRRVGRHTHLQRVYVRYAGAPSNLTGLTAKCSGIIEVSVWEVGRANKAEQKDKMNILATQLDKAIKNAEIELTRRTKQQDKTKTNGQ